MFKAGAPLEAASQADTPALNWAMYAPSTPAVSRTNITAGKAPAMFKLFLVVMPCVADLSQSKFFSSLIFAIGTAGFVQSGSILKRGLIRKMETGFLAGLVATEQGVTSLN